MEQVANGRIHFHEHSESILMWKNENGKQPHIYLRMSLQATKHCWNNWSSMASNIHIPIQHQAGLLSRVRQDLFGTGRKTNVNGSYFETNENRDFIYLKMTAFELASMVFPPKNCSDAKEWKWAMSNTDPSKQKESDNVLEKVRQEYTEISVTNGMRNICVTPFPLQVIWFTTMDVLH